MALRYDIPKAVRTIAGPMLAVMLTAYFGINAFQGDRGALRIIELRREVVRAEHTLQAIAAHRAHLEARIQALRSDRLDPDYLDERARLMTGFVGPRDIVVTGAVAAPAPGRLQGIVGAPRRIRR